MKTSCPCWNRCWNLWSKWKMAFWSVKKHQGFFSWLELWAKKFTMIFWCIYWMFSRIHIDPTKLKIVYIQAIVSCFARDGISSPTIYFYTQLVFTLTYTWLYRIFLSMLVKLACWSRFSELFPLIARSSSRNAHEGSSPRDASSRYGPPWQRNDAARYASSWNDATWNEPWPSWKNATSRAYG